MPRHTRLALAEHPPDLADGELALRADAEDPQTRRFGGSSQAFDDLWQGATCHSA